MKIIYNKYIPFKGFLVINLFGIMFVREREHKVILYRSDINHEEIHTAQMKEMLYIFFYLWYVIEWIIKSFKYGTHLAYYKISFEKEAYNHQYHYNYIAERKHYNWFKLI